MKTYVYVLKLTERLYDDNSWTEKDNLAVEEHFYRLQKDYKEGIVLHVGRTVDPTKDGFGLVIFLAENDLAARNYMNEDPAVTGGQMTSTCMQYKKVLG